MQNLKYFILVIICSFFALSTVKADGGVCTYKNEVQDVYYICTYSNVTNSVSCRLDNRGGINVRQASNFTKSLSKNNFFNNKGEFSCSSSVYVKMNQSTSNGTTTSSLLGIYGSKADCEAAAGSSCSRYTNVRSESHSTGNTVPGEDEPNNQNGGNSGNQTSNLDLEHFCKGNVVRVFNMLGWLFFVVKIVIPLILVVFGCIDFAKAVLSNKDDDIKKSAKSLIIRVIAGIVIFLIPSVINMVINLIGDRADGVYRGTFADCTSCMLKPNQEMCTTLVGSDK